MTNREFRALLKYYPRLKDFYEIGALQRCELEAFVNAALQSQMVAVTADGELVQAGDTVYIISRLGIIESATVLESKVVSDYFDETPIQQSFSSEQAARNYQKHNQ